MAARFFIAVVIFAFIFAFGGKWLYLYLLKFFKKEENTFDNKYEDIEFESKRCRSYDTHDFAGSDDESMCRWCGKRRKDVYKDIKKKRVAKS